MSELKNINKALEKASTAKEIFTLDFVADRAIKNYTNVTGRPDGNNWFNSEVLAVMSIFAEKPNLAQCDKMSIWGCIMTAARNGLSIADGDLDLVPYGKILKAERNYKGMRKQLRTMNTIKFVNEAQVVWKDEPFVHDKLNNKIIKHEAGKEPKIKTLDNIDAAYVRIEFTDGTYKDVVMYQGELMVARNKSKMRGEDAPWNTSTPEMCKKSVLKRANKVYYQSTAKAIPDDQFTNFEVSDDGDQQEEQMQEAEVVNEQPVQEEHPVQSEQVPPPTPQPTSAKKRNMDKFLEE